jgi:hypothetical protein
VDINRAWNVLEKNIKASSTEGLGDMSWNNKPWFDEECTKLLDQRK